MGFFPVWKSTTTRDEGQSWKPFGVDGARKIPLRWKRLRSGIRLGSGSMRKSVRFVGANGSSIRPSSSTTTGSIHEIQRPRTSSTSRSKPCSWREERGSRSTRPSKERWSTRSALGKWGAEAPHSCTPFCEPKTGALSLHSKAGHGTLHPSSAPPEHEPPGGRECGLYRPGILP